MENIEIKGAKELSDKLKSLPSRLTKQVLRTAVKDGAKIMRMKAKELAPISSSKGNTRPNHPAGTLKRAATSAYAKELSSNVQQSYVITFRKGKREQRNSKKTGKSLSRDAFYASWVEFGHKIVPRRSVIHPGTLSQRRKNPIGMVPPHPFLRPAFEASSTQATNTVIESIKAGLLKLADK